MKRLFFVRHGLTNMNVSGHWSGRTEAVLTNEGMTQAINAGKHIKANLPRIDLIISSPQVRARHTAELIATELGYPLSDIKLSDYLVERSFGDLEGTPGDDFFKHHEYHEIDYVLGVETIEQMQIRANVALKYISKMLEDNILIVSHGSFGRAFIRSVNSLPHTQEYDGDRLQIGNAEVLELI
jgi:broad specificity phosphatase PhoE